MSSIKFPDPPDPKRLAEVREGLEREQARRRAEQSQARRNFMARIPGGQIKDIAAYTLIPAMLLAGPALGYGLGRLVEWRWGGSPWGVVLGSMFGLAAAFKQIYLILMQKTAPPAGKGRR